MVMTGSTFVHVLTYIRDNRLGLRNHRPGFRNNRFGVCNCYVGIDCQLGLKRGALSLQTPNGTG